jgi:hypothetical protein
MKSGIVSYHAVIAGTRLMMHNEQLANPFNEYAQALSKVTHKRGKSLEDFQAIAEIEFQGGLYFDQKQGPYIPARCLNKMLVMGARRRKLGKMFEQMVLVDQEVNPVRYEGPRTRKELWLSGKFVDQRLVGVNAARTLRTRPLFTDWSCGFDIKVLDGAVDVQAIQTALEAAEVIGILDGRPIYAGQFRTEFFKLNEESFDVAAE